MKKIGAGLFALVLAVLLSLAPLASQAQCTMCKTQVEAARTEKDSYDTSGLNKGIVYLMTVPYLLIGTIGYFWYRNTHKKNK
ncbi:hypothetical protein [Hymenobacter chitinivorans]|uniref:Uncharacterized protein n=1 Tax=Hymenobacter chitinivorans DSM 11115 TaxID=1121954 RepID=A0A2M9AQR6_9BACT|nr:hypothetical protein [Hymenobacter chitinivorans]PJJ47983.1 hypothetical protein CLV45_4674 [Hymenobacter chitinivorans DSM 11115]